MQKKGGLLKSYQWAQWTPKCSIVRKASEDVAQKQSDNYRRRQEKERGKEQINRHQLQMVDLNRTPLIIMQMMKISMN